MAFMRHEAEKADMERRRFGDSLIRLNARNGSSTRNPSRASLTCGSHEVGRGGLGEPAQTVTGACNARLNQRAASTRRAGAKRRRKRSGDGQLRPAML